MNIRKYWARETVSVQPPGARHPFDIDVCGGSAHDLDDARREARARAERVRNAISSGRPPQRYLYSDRPLREEVLEEIRHRGDLVAVVTRNSYGSKVLNTTNTMFIDIDFELNADPSTGAPPQTHPWFKAEPTRPPAGFWAKLKKAFEDDSAERREAGFHQALTHIHQVAGSFPKLSMRVYRTFGGYRCLVTNSAFDPTSSESESILRKFQSDPLYIKLCTIQKCYRARLTPKYWRCDAAPPTARFPFRDKREEQRYRRWQNEYEHGIVGYSTCRLVAEIGPQRIDEPIRPVLELHDRLACGESEELA